MAEKSRSPELRRESKPHLYSIEKASELSFSRDASVSSPAMFRTTCTSAVAVEEANTDEIVISASDTSEEQDSAQIHAVLETATGLLQPGDRCILSVALEGNCFLVVVKHSEEQSAILGLERCDRSYQLTLAVPVQGLLKLDGDGGFNLTPLESRRLFQFKPASVRSLWSAVQVLMKLLETAQTMPAGPWLWLDAYRALIADPAKSSARWSVELPEKVSELDLIRRQLEQQSERPTPNNEELQVALIAKLKELMFACDLDSITSKDLREGLEKHFGFSMKEHRAFIDNQMIVIMGQMEKASKIFDYLFLGTEWNACNWEELEANNCKYIINVTKEISNFFPDKVKYHNIRVYDTSATKLLPHWENTYRFIREARRNGSSVLVHCKMGVSRSASTVIAYAMKQYSWSLDSAYAYVKKRRKIVNPNDGFRQQLIVYEGILRAKRDSGSWGRRLLPRQDSEMPAEVAAVPYCHTIGRVTPPSSPHTSPPSSPVPGYPRDTEPTSDDEKHDKRRLNSFSSAPGAGSPGSSDTDENAVVTVGIGIAVVGVPSSAAAAASGAGAGAAAGAGRPYVAQMVARFLNEDAALTTQRVRARSMSPSVRGGGATRPVSSVLDYHSAESLSSRDVSLNAPPEVDELGRSAPVAMLHASGPPSRVSSRPASRNLPLVLSSGPEVPQPIAVDAAGAVLEPVQGVQHMFAPPPLSVASAHPLAVAAGRAQPPPLILEPGLVSVTSVDDEETIPVTNGGPAAGGSGGTDSRVSTSTSAATITAAALAGAAAAEAVAAVGGGLLSRQVSSVFGDARSVLELHDISERAAQTSPLPSGHTDSLVAELQRELRAARTHTADLQAALVAVQRRVAAHEGAIDQLGPTLRRLASVVDSTDDNTILTAPAAHDGVPLSHAAVIAWPCQQVCTWLDSVGLSSFATRVEREGVTGQDLLDFSHDDLRALGLATFADRRAVLRAVARLRHTLIHDSSV
eukprot:m.123848 g.123848  ORF g.123848 m.123848 type:complete len:973 (-) comp14632_c4_seq7:24-2942(-)